MSIAKTAAVAISFAFTLIVLGLLGHFDLPNEYWFIGGGLTSLSIEAVVRFAGKYNV